MTYWRHWHNWRLLLNENLIFFSFLEHVLNAITLSFHIFWSAVEKPQVINSQNTPVDMWQRPRVPRGRAPNRPGELIQKNTRTWNLIVNRPGSGGRDFSAQLMPGHLSRWLNYAHVQALTSQVLWWVCVCFFSFPNVGLDSTSILHLNQHYWHTNRKPCFVTALYYKPVYQNSVPNHLLYLDSRK